MPPVTATHFCTGSENQEIKMPTAFTRHRNENTESSEKLVDPSDNLQKFGSRNFIGSISLQRNSKKHEPPNVKLLQGILSQMRENNSQVTKQGLLKDIRRSQMSKWTKESLNRRLTQSRQL